MAEIKLAAEPRTEFGKGAARRIRRDNKIPAVLYGHGTDPVHVTLPGHESMLALRQTNVLLSIELDGKGQLAVAKDVQRDPVRNVIEHIDLQVVRAGEKITVDVTVNIVGESAPGTIHLVEEQTLSVEAEATHLPESVDVSIEGLEAGAQVHAEEVTLPAGATLLTDPKAVVVLITEPRGEASADEESADSAESAAEAPAEG
ncbi:50S ribosomal protein L25/general stress protein Ctc [Promicromonospora thailandica]|uniref:Large ribosomal subunit protein bL25 n=1 Tax=Promicromonospora thailandica TaxID=765201 RepID=A0A9X2JVW9_9MICO|nr:50S ribosomal protein L25/general stress protein Ctc [Promicromonospora thailandica]MCP2264528.1 large subunit ribosomal protein L25 [Promicromonospora thailandica]BFF20407.1 50S ribosomal protein L25/general stress protein Ctc [Promicromonospora thailandica]